MCCRYAVVRFLADNPGYWFMHCHTEFHNEDGMALYLKVGEEEEMNKAPRGMNTCGHFHWTSEQFQEATSSPQTFNRQTESTQTNTARVADWLQATLVLLAFSCALLLGMVIVLMIKKRHMEGLFGFSKLF